MYIYTTPIYSLTIHFHLVKHGTCQLALCKVTYLNIIWLIA